MKPGAPADAARCPFVGPRDHGPALHAPQPTAPAHARQLSPERAAPTVIRSAMPHDSTTIPVDSSWIHSVTYASDATLTVRFRRGTVYRYFTVPRSILEGLLMSPRTAPTSRIAFGPPSPTPGRRASTAVLTPSRLAECRAGPRF